MNSVLQLLNIKKKYLASILTWISCCYRLAINTTVILKEGLKAFSTLLDCQRFSALERGRSTRWPIPLDERQCNAVRGSLSASPNREIGEQRTPFAFFPAAYAAGSDSRRLHLHVPAPQLASTRLYSFYCRHQSPALRTPTATRG